MTLRSLVMEETLEERLSALERALTDGEHDCSALAEGAATADRVEDLDAQLADLTDRVAELEAATQALRGYVGNVRSVNQEIEDRANRALAKAETAHRVATGDPDAGDERTQYDPATASADAGDRAGSPEDSRSGADTASRSSPDQPADSPERSGDPVDRCDRCDRPFGDEPTPSTPRIEALRETDPDGIPIGAPDGTAGAETDGGVPDETGTGLLARLRDVV